MEFSPSRLRGIGAVPVRLNVPAVVAPGRSKPPETPIEIAPGIDRRWSASVGTQSESAVSRSAGATPSFLGEDGGEEQEGEEREEDRRLHLRVSLMARKRVSLRVVPEPAIYTHMEVGAECPPIRPRSARTAQAGCVLAPARIPHAWSNGSIGSIGETDIVPCATSVMPAHGCYFCTYPIRIQTFLQVAQGTGNDVSPNGSIAVFTLHTSQSWEISVGPSDPARITWRIWRMEFDACAQ